MCFTTWIQCKADGAPCFSISQQCLIVTRQFGCPLGMLLPAPSTLAALGSDCLLGPLNTTAMLDMCGSSLQLFGHWERLHIGCLLRFIATNQPSPTTAASGKLWRDSNWMYTSSVSTAAWSSGMILASGARSPGFNSRSSPHTLSAQGHACSLCT